MSALEGELRQLWLPVRVVCQYRLSQFALAMERLMLWSGSAAPLSCCRTMCCFRSLVQLRRILSEKAETVEALDNVMFHLQVSNLSTLRKQALLCQYGSTLVGLSVSYRASVLASVRACA